MRIFDILTRYSYTVHNIGSKIASLCDCAGHYSSCSGGEYELKEPVRHFRRRNSNSSPVCPSYEGIPLSIAQCVAEQPVTNATKNCKTDQIQSVKNEIKCFQLFVVLTKHRGKLLMKTLVFRLTNMLLQRLNFLGFTFS